MRARSSTTSSESAQRVEVTRSRVPAGRPLFAFAATALLVAASVAALNVALDPHEDFRTGLVPPLTTRDEAGVKRALLAALPAPPDAVVLGSSRAMKIAPDDLAAEGRAAPFNMAFSSATTTDVLAAYRHVAARHAPDEIVVAFEPDLLTGKRSDRWDATNAPRKGLNETARLVVASYKLDYVFDSLLALRYAIFGFPASTVSFDADGLFHYVQWEALSPRPPPDPMALSSAIEASVGWWSSENATIDPARLDATRALFDEAHRDGVRVTAFLPPLHPRLHDALGSTAFPTLHDAALAELRASCAPGDAVFDFTRIDSFGGLASDFKDTGHYGPENARRIVAAFGTAPNLCEA